MDWLGRGSQHDMAHNLNQNKQYVLNRQPLTFGLSVRNHVRNCALRSNNSVYQNPRVVDSHEIC